MKNSVSLKYIKGVVEHVTSIKNISKKSRRRDIVYARQIYFYISRKYTTKSLMLIGRFVGKDHATVMHGCKKVDNVLKPDIMYNGLICKIDSIIRIKQEELLSTESGTEDLTIYGLKRISDLEKTIEQLELQLFVSKQREKYNNKKYGRLDLELSKIPEDKIDMFCETRIQPFVKMYGNKI